MTDRFGTQDEKGSLEDAARLIVAWLGESKSTVAFTGAGISTESGTPKAIHWPNPISTPYVSLRKPARSAFGGVPMIVPTPPTVAP